MNKWVLALIGGAGLWVFLRSRRAQAVQVPWDDPELPGAGPSKVPLPEGPVVGMDVGSHPVYVDQPSLIPPAQLVEPEILAEGVTTIPLAPGAELPRYPTERIVYPGIDLEPMGPVVPPGAGPRPSPEEPPRGGLPWVPKGPKIPFDLGPRGPRPGIRRWGVELPLVPEYGAPRMRGPATQIPLRMEDRPLMGFAGAFDVPIFEVPTLPVLSPQRYGPDFTVRPHPHGFPGASVGDWL